MQARCRLMSVAVVVACLFGGRDVGAEKVFHFWGDYIKQWNENKFKGNRLYRNSAGTLFADIDIDNDGANDDSRVVHEFSMESILNPRQFDRLYPEFEYRVDSHGATFYGGMRAQYLNQQRKTIHQAFVHDEGADFNRIDEATGRPLRSGNEASPEVNPVTGELYEQFSEITLFTWHDPDHADFPEALSTFEATFIWKSEDFLSDPWDTVVLDSDSEMLITTTRKWDNIGEARFVIQDGDGSFYVSELWFGARSATGHDVTMNPLDAVWAPWDPEADTFDFEFDANAAVFDFHTFSEVKAFGVYFEQDQWTNVETKLVFDQLRLDATVLPGGDLNGDGDVDGDDYDILAASYGETGADLVADINGDEVVNAADYVALREDFTAVGVAGDYNGDGFVSSADFDAWALAYGGVGGELTADGNDDGVVNAADYALWRESFASGEAASAAAVPEPSGLVVLAVLAGLSSLVRKSDRGE